MGDLGQAVTQAPTLAPEAAPLGAAGADGSGPTPAPRRRPLRDPRRRADGATALTVVVIALFAIPARLVFPPMGAAGRPAAMLGLGLFAWWVLSRLVPALTRRGRQPIRTVLLVYLFVYLVAYTLGYARGLPGIEAVSSDRALLSTLALVGIALITADGVPTRARLDVLLKRLTIAGGFMALVGELQFTTGFDLAGMIAIPGLALNADLVGIAERGDAGLSRVAGTTAHYIEFGVVSALLLPLAIHFAVFARDRAERQWRWALVGVLGVAVPFSISRSGLICLVVVMVVLGLIWNLRMQLQAAVVGFVGLVALQGMVGGLLGTILSLFENLGNDPSVEGREEDFPIVFRYIGERPWFGRGPGTFMPERYFILDNEILGTTLATGYVGLVALLAVFVVSGVVARSLAKRTPHAESRHLAQALLAGIVGAFVASFTFDSLSHATFAGTLFLLVGAVGALWRTERDGDPIPHRPGPGALKPNRVRRLRPARGEDVGVTARSA